jgi:hypothetical protein
VTRRVRNGCKNTIFFGEDRVSAPGTDFALLTFGSQRTADLLSVLDEECIERHPVPVWEDSSEFLFGFVGLRGADQTPSVGDAVDMGIDTDRWEMEGKRPYKIGGFSADSGNREKIIDLAWRLSGEPVTDDFPNLDQVNRLSPVHSDRENQRFNGFRVSFGECVRCSQMPK